MGATKNLVLGGSGTIGSALCRILRAKGEEVINLDLKTGVDLRSASLEDYSGVDYVWFLAWEVGGAKYLSNPDHHYAILSDNSLLCSQVFAFLKKSGLPFLFSSSQLAAPDNPYGITKLLGENFTRALGGVIVRFWNVYGWEEPGEKSHVITDLVLQALAGRSIRLLTTGEEERQFIHIDDCVRNLLEIRGQRMQGPIHLTNGHWMKIKDLAETVGRMYRIPVEAGTQAGYQNKIDPDASHLRFQWDIGMDEGLRQVASEARTYLQAQSHVSKTS